MRHTPIIPFLLTIGLIVLPIFQIAQAQSTAIKQAINYRELKGLLLKHRPTVESILSMKRFKLVSSKVRPESIIYAYKKESGVAQILVRLRKSDGLVSEVAWHEQSETLGNLTHDAIDDGFVPVAGNSHYYSRFEHMALLVDYKLADDKVVPCILRAVQ